MRKRFNVFMVCGLMLAGCSEFDPDPNNPKDVCPSSQIDMPTFCPNLDLAPPPPKCIAAKGLTGDALICVDADKITLADLRIQGWIGFKDGTGTDCWEIAGGKLQVKNFGTFVGTCSFTMPLTDLAAAANQKYQSVTLAVVQRVDVNSAPIVTKYQIAQVFLGLASPTLQLSSYSGPNPRQQSNHAITRTDLAATTSGGTSFQPLFQLTSAAPAPGNTGWQIESIAVVGNP